MFEFTWDAHELSDETIIRFYFVPISKSATRVTVTSFVFDDLETAFLVIATWRAMLERLKIAVEASKPVPENENRVATLIKEIRLQHGRT